MGQHHRLQPLMQMGAKHPHQPHTAAYMKKLLIWSLAVVLPFLVLVCIFPSSASDLYKPSYNRNIVVSQFQIPRVQSGNLESKLSSGAIEDDNVGASGDAATTLISSGEKKQSNPMAEAENSGVGKADSLPKATKIHRAPKEAATPSITEVDELSSSKAEKQDHETMIKSSSAVKGNLSSSKLKKQSNGGEEKKHTVGHEGNSLPKKSKKKNDEDVDDDLMTSKEKKQKETEVPTIDVKSSKKTQKQTHRDGEDEPKINAFMTEREADEQNGEPNTESKKKNLDAESDAKKKTKGGKTTQYNAEEMPEIGLDEEFLSVSAKKEVVKPISAHVESKKSTKKAKAMHDTDELDLTLEDSIAIEKNAGQDDEGSSTAKPSKKAKFSYANELEEEEISILGKKSSVEEEEDPTSFKSTSAKPSSRKAMGMRSYNGKDDEDVSYLGKKSRSKKKGKVATEERDEEDVLTHITKKASSFATSGNPSDDGDGDGDDGGKSSADLLSLKRADDEGYLLEPTNAKKQKKELPSGNDVDDSSPDLAEVDETEREGRKEVSKKEAKDAYSEEEYSITKQKHGNSLKTYGSSPSKFGTKRSPQSSKDDDDNEFSLDFGKNEEGSSDDSMDSSASSIAEALPSKPSMSSGTCRYFKGRWTMDSNDLPYVDSTCRWKFVNEEKSCKTTRKSRNWRWQPSACNMKRFRAAAFLKLMKGKSMAFVGDKMVRGQLKSLVCLLDQVETPRLLYDDKSNQSMSWHFNSSNVTISLIWSPYLVQQTTEGQYSKLWLDKLDTKWATMVPTLDVLVLGVGAHFAQPSVYTIRNSAVGCYSCQNLSSYIDITNLKEISLYSGFRAAMRSSILGIGALPGFSGIALFLQPFGFEGNGSYYGVSLKMKGIQDQELKKAQRRGSISNQSKMEVLHTNLKSVSSYDPIKGLYSRSCLVPSPLANTWNQVLQHTLTRMFTLELDI